MITAKEVNQLLEELKIQTTDTITVHCSLKAIGTIEHGADGLIDSFTEYLKDGLFIVPTHTWDEVSLEHPYYDVAKSVPCIGTLSKVAAFRPDGVRSLHPTHSVAAFGKSAKDFVSGEEQSKTPSPMGGCLSRLYEMKGKILLIGVGHNRNTYLHSIDERLGIPNRINPKSFRIEITDYDGTKYVQPEFHTHYSSGLPCCCSEFYPNYKNALDYGGAVAYAKLGNALVYCVDAVKCTDIIASLWSKADYDLCSMDKEIPKEYYM